MILQAVIQTLSALLLKSIQRRVYDNDGYMASLHRDNVHVVDDSVVFLLEKAALTKSGKVYPADVIVSTLFSAQGL